MTECQHEHYITMFHKNIVTAVTDSMKLHNLFNVKYINNLSIMLSQDGVQS